MTHEKVLFRMFQMPCCGQALCWVNPRLPNHCPECGERVYVQLKSGQYTVMLAEGWLKLEEDKAPHLT
jgi:hypothetical protein